MKNKKEDKYGLKNNLKKVMGMLHEYDKKFVFVYFLVILYRIAFPTIFSFTWKYIIDYIAYGTDIDLYYAIGLFGIYTFLMMFDKYFYWIYYKQYFEYLIRGVIQNKIVYKFTKTISNLDMSQLEDSNTHDEIAKNDGTMIWHIPVMIESLASLIVGVVSFVIVLLILINYSIWVPLVLILVNIPTIFLQMNKAKVEYSMWGITVPHVKSLHYVKGLLLGGHSIRELKMFSVIDNMLSKLLNLQENIFRTYKKPLVEYKNRALFPNILVGIAIFVVLAYFLNSFIMGAITLGTLIFIKDNVLRFSNETESVYGSISALYSNNIYARSYFKFLDINPKMKESKNPKKVNFKDGVEIEFKNVSFKYPKSSRFAIENISFKINNGENLAIVGENGSGKSTIIKLLFRNYDVTKGKILINGINVKDILFKDLNKGMSILFQDHVSYNFTVKKNISLSNMGTFNMKDIKEAAELSYADDFIAALPKGYDQQLGKHYRNGEELSGGQWQRLAISRIIYKNSPILILDEGTSRIDSDTEYKIFNNLFSKYKDKTLILISHRYSSIKKADKIIVLNKGEFVEMGNHDQLMEKNGVYKKSYNMQAKQYES